MRDAEAAIAERYRLMAPQLNERQRRRFAAAEARIFGHGGVAGAGGAGGGGGGRGSGAGGGSGRGRGGGGGRRTGPEGGGPSATSRSRWRPTGSALPARAA